MIAVIIYGKLAHLIVTTAKNMAPVSNTYNLNTGTHIFNHWDEAEEEEED